MAGQQLGQQFVVENRPGGGSSVAAEYVVRAPADGYTLLLSTVANAINTSFYKNLGFDFMRDIVSVADVMHVPLVMEVSPSVPAKTVAEFIAYAKATRARSPWRRAGSAPRAISPAELFAMMAGVKMLHVPYRGSRPGPGRRHGRQCQVIFDLLPSSVGYIRAGKRARSR